VRHARGVQPYELLALLHVFAEMFFPEGLARLRLYRRREQGVVCWVLGVRQCRRLKILGRSYAPLHASDYALITAI
jgi:hypothetical protein